MSSINPNNIDGTYPIAGQDNDSQGFRDNFTNIKNNLNFAATELTDLQQNALLKAPLGSVGQSATNNDLNYAQIIHAAMLATVDTFSNIGVPSTSTPSISWAAANYQSITLSQATTITAFTNWPAASLGVYARFRLQVIVPNTAYTLTLPSSVVDNLSDIQGAVGQTINFPSTGLYLYEFSSNDGGTTISISDLVNNYQTVSNISISGTLTTKGARVVGGYQLTAPAANAAVTIGNNVERLIITPTTTSTPFGMIVTLPNANVDATTVSISSNVAIAGLQVNPNAGTVLLPSANIALSAGSASTFFFHATESKWYKIG